MRPDYWIGDEVQVSSNDAVATGNMATRVTADFCTLSRHSGAKILLSSSQSSVGRDTNDVSCLNGSVVVLAQGQMDFFGSK